MIQKKPTKSTNRIIFPHPLVRSFNPVTQTQPSKIPSYLPIKKQSLSEMMIKTSHSHPIVNENFGILVHPLYPNVQLPQYQNASRCPQCKILLTYQTLTYDRQCRICCKQIKNVPEQLIKDTKFDLVDSHTSNYPNKTLIVIQKNQYLYNCSMHCSILEVLRGLQFSVINENEIDQEIGIIFYDDTTVYLLNLRNQQLIKTCSTNFTEDDGFPVDFDDMMVKISEIDLEFVNEVSQQLMYQGYKKKESCIDSVLKLCDSLFNKSGIQVMILAHNPPYLGIKTHQSIQVYLFNDKHRQLSHQNNKQNIILHARRQSDQQHLTKNTKNLNENIHQIYSHLSFDQVGFYYDFYHYLTRERYFQVETIIKTNSNQLLLSSKTDTPISLHQNKQLLFDFQVQKSKASNQTMGIVYMEFILPDRSTNTNKSRVLIYQLKQIIEDPMRQIKYINDETFFFISVLRSIQEYKNKLAISKTLSNKPPRKPNNVDQIHRLIQLKILKLMKKLNSMGTLCKSQQCSIPSNIYHTLIYLYMLSKRKLSLSKEICFSQVNAMMNEGLETITKKLYPKIYKITSHGKIKPMKFNPRTFQFEDYPLLILDDGKYINIVLNQQITSQNQYFQLQQLFGTCGLTEVLEMTQVPEVQNSEMNKKLREIINIVREHNNMYYLPLKVMTHDCQQFNRKYDPYTYIEKQHFRQLQNIVMKAISH